MSFHWPPLVAITGTQSLKAFLRNYDMYGLESNLSGAIINCNWFHSDSTQVTTDKMDLNGISPYVIIVLHFQRYFSKIMKWYKSSSQLITSEKLSLKLISKFCFGEVKIRECHSELFTHTEWIKAYDSSLQILIKTFPTLTQIQLHLLFFTMW